MFIKDIELKHIDTKGKGIKVKEISRVAFSINANKKKKPFFIQVL